MYTLLFLTDYGWQDAYVGTLKAVALSTLTPQARSKTTLVDLSHAVPAFQVQIGAWHLLTSLPYCPPEAVFVCVVDPNVGSAEQGVLLAYRASYNQWFIAPDNGLLAPLLQADATIQTWRFSQQSVTPFGWHYPNETVEKLAGSTFAGRDLYAPLGAMLLNKQVQGINLVAWVTELANQFNANTQTWQACSGWEAPKRLNEASLEGTVLTNDGFGNAILTIPHFWLDTSMVQVGFLVNNHPPISIPLVNHYSALPIGGMGIVRGSHGYLEVACNQGSAEKKLGIQAGMVVCITTATSV